MNKIQQSKRIRTKYKIRKTIFGTASCPRVSVFKSNSNFYAQVIDDENSRTLASSSTLKMKDLKSKSNIEAAKAVAEDLAKKMFTKKIDNIVFDRNGYIYHGKIKAFADILRDSGIKF